MDHSISTLERMAENLGAEVRVVREVEVESALVAHQVNYDEVVREKSSQTMGHVPRTDSRGTKDEVDDTASPRQQSRSRTPLIKPELLFKEKRKRKKAHGHRKKRDWKVGQVPQPHAENVGEDPSNSNPPIHQLSRGMSFGRGDEEDDDDAGIGFLNFNGDDEVGTRSASTPDDGPAASPTSDSVPPLSHTPSPPSSVKHDESSLTHSTVDSLSTSISLQSDPASARSKVEVVEGTSVGDAEDGEARLVWLASRRQWKKEQQAAKRAAKKVNGDWVAQQHQQRALTSDDPHRHKHPKRTAEPSREERFLDGLVGLFEGVQMDDVAHAHDAHSSSDKQEKQQKDKPGPIPPSSGLLTSLSMWQQPFQPATTADTSNGVEVRSTSHGGGGDDVLIHPEKLLALTKVLGVPHDPAHLTDNARSPETSDLRRFVVECLVFYPSEEEEGGEGKPATLAAAPAATAEGYATDVDNDGVPVAPAPDSAARNRLPSFIDYERAFL